MAKRLLPVAYVQSVGYIHVGNISKKEESQLDPWRVVRIVLPFLRSLHSLNGLTRAVKSSSQVLAYTPAR